MIQRWNVSVVKDSDSPCDCRADLVAASDGDFVLHRESHEAIRSWMQNSENYAKLLDNALRERDEAKRCLHVEMSMRKDAEVEPPKSVGPWHVVPGHDGAFVPVTKDGRSWWNGYFQASIAIDVATLLNERESHSAEIAKLRAQSALFDAQRDAVARELAGLGVEYGTPDDYARAASGAIERLRAEADDKTIRLRDADMLADEVAALVKRRVIDSRSAASDALLRYREDPRTERSDRIAALEAALSAARAALDGERAKCDEAKWFIEYLSATNDGQRADAEAWLFGYRARRAAEAQPKETPHA